MCCHQAVNHIMSKLIKVAAYKTTYIFKAVGLA